MSMFEILYTVDGRELARESLGDVPAIGEELFIEQTAGVVEGGLFEVVGVRRVLSEVTSEASIQRGQAGGAIDVVPRSAYVTLKRAPKGNTRV